MSIFKWKLDSDIAQEEEQAHVYEIRAAALHAVLHGDDLSRADVNLFDELAQLCLRKVDLLRRAQTIIDCLQQPAGKRTADSPSEPSNTRVH